MGVRLVRNELEEYAEYVKRGMPISLVESPTAKILNRLLGDIRPVVDSVYNFDDVPKAYERLMSRHATGKVVVCVDSTIPDESL